MNAKKNTPEAVVRAYYREIFRFCLSKLVSREDAQDVTQDVFLTYCRKAPQLDGQDARWWLYATAQNKILNETQKQKRRAQTLIPDADAFPNDGNWEYEITETDWIADARIEEKKAEILEHLTPEERALFREIFDKRRKHAELAAEQGVSEQALNMRVYRLRRKIMRMIETAFCLLLYWTTTGGRS